MQCSKKRGSNFERRARGKERERGWVGVAATRSAMVGTAPPGRKGGVLEVRWTKKINS